MVPNKFECQLLISAKHFKNKIWRKPIKKGKIVLKGLNLKIHLGSGEILEIGPSSYEYGIFSTPQKQDEKK